MAHQDFEKYARQKPIFYPPADNWKKFFLTKIYPKISKPIMAKVLDYGCGDGRYFSWYLSYFSRKNIYGTEISRLRINRARKIGWKKTYFVRKLEKLPFKNDYFDFINCDQVIEHILASENDFYLTEMQRVLKPGGLILFVTPNYPIKRIYDLMYFQFKDDPTHVCLFNFQRLKILLKKYFSTVRLHPTGGIFYRLFFNHNLFSHKILALAKK